MSDNEDRVNYSLHYDATTGEYVEHGREGLDRYLNEIGVEWDPKDCVTPAPRPTRYQWIFRSPWTYLVLAAYFTFLATQHHQAWYLRTLYITVSVFAWLDFWNKADKRWGRP